MGDKNNSAFPFAFGDITQYQFSSSGITKLEYFALHLMLASVSANDHTHPSHTDEDMAKQHAQNAIRLARALMVEIENENGR